MSSSDDLPDQLNSLEDSIKLVRTVSLSYQYFFEFWWPSFYVPRLSLLQMFARASLRVRTHRWLNLTVGRAVLHVLWVLKSCSFER